MLCPAQGHVQVRGSNVNSEMLGKDSVECVSVCMQEHGGQRKVQGAYDHRETMEREHRVHVYERGERGGEREIAGKP